jgi:hypothetical protein
LSQICAKNTASAPNRTAKPIMTKVLVRTATPCTPQILCAPAVVTFAGVQFVKLIGVLAVCKVYAENWLKA